MTMFVADIMTRNLKTIGSDISVSEAYVFSRSNNIRHLLVVDPTSNLFVGILSDRDINRIISPFYGTAVATEQDNATLEMPVRVVMRKNAISCKPTDLLKTLVEKMLSKKISGIPVVDDMGKLVGIVTAQDLCRTLLSLL